MLVVTNKSVADVAEALDVDLSTPYDFGDDEEVTGWALTEVSGGVVGFEQTGFGDPSLDALESLSEGGAAAVVRSNVLGHERFGCARGGHVLFDDNEYPFVDDPDEVPGELRDLFDLVYDDLEEDDVDDDPPSPFAVGLAMAEVGTGVELTTEHAALADSLAYHRAPALLYTDEGDE